LLLLDASRTLISEKPVSGQLRQAGIRFREEELFAEEPHTAQAKPSHSDPILQLREQRFHLLAGSLRHLKRRHLG
jgi:hypothetical protein